MSESQSTIEDPTLYQGMGDLLSSNPEEQGIDVGVDDVKTDKIVAKKAPDEVKQSCNIRDVDTLPVSSTEGLTDLPCGENDAAMAIGGFKHILCDQERKISSLKESNRFLTEHVRKLYHELDSLKEGIREIKGQIQGEKTGICANKRGRDATDQVNVVGRAEERPKRQKTRVN